MEEMYEITKDGYKKLVDELANLKANKRTEVAEKLKIARSYGDLSENAEYDAAKNEQAEIEARIVKLENDLKNAKVIGTRTNTSVARTGHKVRIKKANDNKTDGKFITLVGKSEADPVNSKISTESPVGKAIFGKAIGDKVSCELPNGKTIKYEILEITN